MIIGRLGLLCSFLFCSANVAADSSESTPYGWSSPDEDEDNTPSPVETPDDNESPGVFGNSWKFGPVLLLGFPQPINLGPYLDFQNRFKGGLIGGNFRGNVSNLRLETSHWGAWFNWTPFDDEIVFGVKFGKQ